VLLLPEVAMLFPLNLFVCYD